MTDLALMRAAEARQRRREDSPRFKSGTFVNAEATAMMTAPPSVGMALEFATGSKKRVPDKPLPVIEDVLARLDQPRTSMHKGRGALRCTWLGHSTVLIEIDGVTIITDPVFGERASPMSFAGPKRFHRPPLALADLPRIDAVVLSHDHYDHLCAPTVRALANGRVPNFQGRFVTTIGTGGHLERLGVATAMIEELDWGMGAKITGEGGATIDVVCCPARHFSGRGALDRNRNLWGSMAILGPHHRVFFSGDTGQTTAHTDIGKSLGPFDVALFEIGAAHPSWADVHLGPEKAWRAFVDIGATALLPVHWATFDLGLHPWAEPGEVLATIAAAEKGPLWLPRLGEPLNGVAGAQGEAWWRAVLGS